EGMVRQHLIVTNVGGDPVPGTSVYVNDKHVGDTNEFGWITHEIPGPHKGDSFKLKVNKSGYQAISRDVLAVVDPGFLTGDVFLGLIFGFIPIMFTLGVDIVTESVFAYPRSLRIVLERKN
ncbi:MAG TPA: hypothetical protein PLC24_09290, partial [Myxococcota bacterium]|nr:hypothetical protein [Myxococcota bacterium]